MAKTLRQGKHKARMQVFIDSSLGNRPKSPGMSFNAKVDRSGAEVDLGRVLDARVSRIVIPFEPDDSLSPLPWQSRHRQAKKIKLSGR
jgi:hypothetical protein